MNHLSGIFSSLLWIVDRGSRLKIEISVEYGNHMSGKDLTVTCQVLDLATEVIM